MRIYKEDGRTITIENDLHDELLIALIKYYEANEVWEEKKWDHKAIEARHALGKLRVIAKERRNEIQAIQKEVIKKRREKKGKNNE